MSDISETGSAEVGGLAIMILVLIVFLFALLDRVEKWETWERVTGNHVKHDERDWYPPPLTDDEYERYRIAIQGQ